MSTPPPNHARRPTGVTQTTPPEQTHPSMPAPPTHEHTPAAHDTRPHAGQDPAVGQRATHDPPESIEMTTPPETGETSVDHNLLSLRTALILLLATCAAIVVGLLSFQAGSGPWKSVLESGAAWVAAVVFSHQILVRRD